MWEIHPDTTGTLEFLFGGDMYVVRRFIEKRTPYQVEVNGFAEAPKNYCIYRYDTKESWEREKVLVAEFDNRDELIAMIRLIMASDTN